MSKLYSLIVIYVVFLLCCVSLSASFQQAVGMGLTPSARVVKEESSKEDKPCLLPFSFKNRIFTSCTNFTDVDGKHW